MKARFLLFLICFFFVSRSLHSQPFSFSLNPASSCYNGSVHTVTAVTTSTGAAVVNSYSWAILTSTCNPTYTLAVPNGSIVNISIPCAGSFTVVGYALASGTLIHTWTSLLTLNVNTISISASVVPLSSPACSGTSFSLVSSGASSYSFSGGSISNGTFIPSSSGCLTVTGGDGTGCTASTTACYSVQASPTVVISGSSQCLTGPTTLTANGATNYTWLPGNLTGSVVVLSPSVNTCYTITGTNANGCAQTIQHCVTVGPSLNVSIQNSPGMICAGNTVTFTAAGALNYTWQPGGMTSHSVVLSPTATTCYSLFGSNAPGCHGAASTCLTVSPVPNLSVVPNATICHGNSTTLLASGAASYTWFPSNLNSATLSVSPAVNTCYTVQGSNAAGCVSTSSTCISVAPNPSVGLWTSIVPLSSPACAGTTYSATVIGLTSYTWSGATVSNGTFIPLSTGCLTLNGTNALGCFASNVTCFSVLPPPPLSLSGNTLLCTGHSSTLLASGANTYTWMPGSVLSPSMTVTPSVSTCYSLSGTDSWGCSITSTFCINVLSLTPITISGNSITCDGHPTFLTASGAMFYNWSNGFNSASIGVAPSVNTCYTVVGLALNGCSNTAVQCVSVLPNPTITIIGSPTVCWGSSVTMTATGASSYTWITFPPVPGSTLFSLPAAGIAWYTVDGTAINGCYSSASHSVFVDASCAIVWPGDANRDGVVSNTDVLELGLAANFTGAARSSTSNAWSAQFANTWGGTISNGWDLAHADCNGDGVINSADNTAISLNFNLTHGFKSTLNNFVNPEINLIPADSLIYVGSWNKADIVLGDTNNTLTQLYGLAFDVDFDQSLVQSDSVKILYTASFLNAANQNIEFGKTVFANSKYYAATVRTDHNNVNGYGKIGEFWYKLYNVVPANSVMNLSVSNAIKVSSNGSSNALSTGSSSVAVSNSPVGLNELLGLEHFISVYPNPASNYLTLHNTSGHIITYSLVDVLGREVFSGEFASLKTLDISSLQQGAYFIEFEIAGITVYKKLVVEQK